LVLGCVAAEYRYIMMQYAQYVCIDARKSRWYIWMQSVGGPAVIPECARAMGWKWYTPPLLTMLTWLREADLPSVRTSCFIPNMIKAHALRCGRGRLVPSSVTSRRSCITRVAASVPDPPADQQLMVLERADMDLKEYCEEHGNPPDKVGVYEW
jgi:hypothetical protein